MNFAKSNIVQTSIASYQYEELMKIFKYHGHDLDNETLAQIIRVELIYPYIRNGLKEMEESNGKTQG